MRFSGFVVSISKNLRNRVKIMVDVWIRVNRPVHDQSSIWYTWHKMKYCPKCLLTHGKIKAQYLFPSTNVT